MRASAVSRSGTGSARVLGFLLGLGLASCAADHDLDLPPVVDESDRVRFRTDSEAEICGGTFAYFEDGLAQFEAVTGTSANRPVDVVWRPEGLGDTPCAAVEDFVGSPGGCYDHPVVYTTFLPGDHELVHAAHHDLGPTDPVFEEGLAVYLGQNEGEPPEVVGSIDTLLGSETGYLMSSTEYELAGHFVAFLAATRGLEPLLLAWDATAPGTPADTVQATLAEHYGEPWDDLAAAYAAWPRCHRGAWRAKTVECVAPSVPWDGGSWTYARALNCAGPDVVGPTYDLMWTAVTLEIETPGTYTLRNTGDDFVEIGRCAVGCDEAFFEFIAPDRERTEALDSGRYYVRVFGETRASAETGLQIVLGGD